MAKVKKGNRVLQVNERELNNYLKQGYDQVDSDGKVVRKATGGRNVTLAEYNKMVEAKDDKITRLEERCVELYDENEKLKAEKGKLTEENNKLKKDLKKAQQEPKKEGK